MLLCPVKNENASPNCGEKGTPPLDPSVTSNVPPSEAEPVICSRSYRYARSKQFNGKFAAGRLRVIPRNGESSG